MKTAPGRYSRALQGYRTFIPAPLPPMLILPTNLQRKVEDATHLLGQVEMCRTLLPNANLLIYSSLQREALASSTIEGTIASPDELLRYQADHYSARADVREVGNYVEALEWGAAEIAKRPLGANLVLGLHERLLAGVRGAGNAGRFKERQNWIGSQPTDAIEQALFVPPPPDQIPDLIGDLERYLNMPQAEPRVVQCALAHYQFETIHPFEDGNGRVGRLLILLHLMQLKLLSAPLIYPSVYFERRRSNYYKCLQGVRDRGAWLDWLDFFVTGVQEQSAKTIVFTQMILRLRTQIEEGMGNIQRRASVRAVLDVFFQEPALPISAVAERAHIAIHSAQAAVTLLEGQGLVYEITGKKKGRVYACRPVIDAIFDIRAGAAQIPVGQEKSRLRGENAVREAGR